MSFLYTNKKLKKKIDVTLNGRIIIFYMYLLCVKFIHILINFYVKKGENRRGNDKKKSINSTACKYRNHLYFWQPVTRRDRSDNDWHIFNHNAHGPFIPIKGDNYIS